MKKIFFLGLSVSLLLGGCSSLKQSPSSDSTEASNQHSDGAVELARNLDVPWSIQKHEDVFYISERPGNIVRIAGSKLERQTVHLSEDLSGGSEAGLLGFILDPNFEENNEAFAYYTYLKAKGAFNRIVKLRLENNEWAEVEILLDQLPAGNYHDGGRLAIGPDNKLYATVGDAYNLNEVQELDSLNGKILRLNLDGTIPEDNPYENSYIFSYGHRNPQGLVWTPDGTMYASEHGNNANDEINIIEAGKNYGWPLIEGTEEQDSMEGPLFTSGSDETWAPSGMDEWNNHLYVAALRGNAILEFDLENQTVHSFIEDYGRIRDVLIVGDALFFITNNLDGRGDGSSDDDKLYRVELN